MDAKCRRRLADDAAYNVAADGWIGTGGNNPACIPGHSSSRRTGRHGGSPALSADHAGLDGDGFGCLRGSEPDAPHHAVGTARIHIHPRTGRGDERPCMAGDHSGDRFQRAASISRCAQFGWL